MKKIHQKHSKIRWLIVLPLLLIIVIIIHSCKKDQSGTATDAVSVAKQWYESTYPVISASATSGRLLKVSVGATSSGTTLDFSQIIKPDWGNAAHYKRLAKDVLELPITSPSTFAAAVKTGAMVAYNKQNSRSSFILLNDGKTYQAFVMMFVADSTYLNKDYSKLNNNTYRHIDKTFSGWLYYFTPKGAIVSGYKYKAGHIVNQIAITNSNKALISTHFGSNPVKTDDVVCTDWYADFYENGVLVNTLPLGSTCIDDGIYAMPNPNPGGGGADDGPPPPIEDIPVTNDPCSQGKALGKNTDFITKLQDLSSKLTLTDEYGYMMNNNNGVIGYTLLDGGPNGLNFNLSPTSFSGSIGFIHVHNANAGNLSIFSADDFQALYLAVKSSGVNNPGAFTFGVVTPSGTYILAINNLNTFLQMGAANLNGGPNALSAFNNLYDFYVKATNTQAQNEAGLSKFLTLLGGGTGLTLMKADASDTTWQTVASDSNNLVTYINCNN